MGILLADEEQLSNFENLHFCDKNSVNVQSCLKYPFQVWTKKDPSSN